MTTSAFHSGNQRPGVSYGSVSQSADEILVRDFNFQASYVNMSMTGPEKSTVIGSVPQLRELSWEYSILAFPNLLALCRLQ